MKTYFNDIDRKTVISLYKRNVSVIDIGTKYGVSKTPINTILRNAGVLRKPNSNGIKIILSSDQQQMIKELYLKEYKSCNEIANKMGLTTFFIDKFLSNCDFRRNKGKAASIGLVKRYRGSNYDEYIESLSEYMKYRKEVLSITNKQKINTLIGYDKRGTYKNNEAYHLDHKYSIIEGFKNKISPEIIGDIKNLEFIPWKENLKKRTKCSITIKQLINNI